MMSNYPPGVTGNEFAIAGPDWESEALLYCFECKEETYCYVWGFDGVKYTECENCGTEKTSYEEYGYYDEDD